MHCCSLAMCQMDLQHGMEIYLCMYDKECIIYDYPDRKILTNYVYSTLLHKN